MSVLSNLQVDLCSEAAEPDKMDVEGIKKAQNKIQDSFKKKSSPVTEIPTVEILSRLIMVAHGNVESILHR